jgi:hypothetical protein
LQTPEGRAFPYYIVPFDRDGRCEGPRTRDTLIERAAACTDIYLFSHGWNNDWSAATARYEDFIKGLMRLRAEKALAVPADYAPMLVGVFWPSQALAWFESETGPDIAGADPGMQDEAVGATTDTLRDIAESLPPEKRVRFYELAQATQLEPAEADELAGLLAALATPDDDGARADAPSAEDLVAAAGTLETPEPDYDEIGTVGGGALTPKAAGILDAARALDPRNLIKPFTVWQMKNRAGQVGANGVAPMLAGLLRASKARVHLLGHSYGCKVVMTAASGPEALPGQIESALLLQPAVSQYAFAASVPGRNVPGGFRRALAAIRRPILATFSQHDTALRRMFHVAVRRHDDLGELQMAAEGTPTRFGALGGFGPQASNATFEPIRDPISAYDLSGTGRIIGVDGTRTISGHGAISQPSTWWAAYSLATAHMRYPDPQDG